MPPQVTWWLGDEVPWGNLWLGVCRKQAYIADARAGLSLGEQSQVDWEGVYAQWKGGAEGVADG